MSGTAVPLRRLSWTTAERSFSSEVSICRRRCAASRSDVGWKSIGSWAVNTFPWSATLTTRALGEPASDALVQPRPHAPVRVALQHTGRDGERVLERVEGLDLHTTAARDRGDRCSDDVRAGLLGDRKLSRGDRTAQRLGDAERRRAARRLQTRRAARRRVGDQQPGGEGYSGGEDWLAAHESPMPTLEAGAGVRFEASSRDLTRSA